MRRLATVLIWTLTLGSCGMMPGSPTGYAEDGCSIRVRGESLVLTNASSAAIHYVALEEETSALVDLAFDARRWPKLEPGETTRIPFEELMGYEPGAKQARVYGWGAEEQRYRHVVVDLR